MRELELGNTAILDILPENRSSNQSPNLTQESEHNISDIGYLFFKKLTYFISAEINNPLAVINTHIHQIQNGIDKKNISLEQLQQSLDRISWSNQKVGRLLKQLRGLSEETGKKEIAQAVFLKQILADTLDLCQGRLLQNQIQVFHGIDPKTIVHVRPTDVMQIFIFIMENAVQSLKSNMGGWIQIEATKAHDKINITIYHNGARWIKDLSAPTHLAYQNESSLQISESNGTQKLILSLPLAK